MHVHMRTRARRQVGMVGLITIQGRSAPPQMTYDDNLICIRAEDSKETDGQAAPSTIPDGDQKA
jgi:hypothetical protein